ncbi:non-ribosomal peptide synthetase [Paraburkholderia azotifigens]|uniref:Non-ribosomal peptide synthetase n=1 Tax=Paraburkholderia azotifigens TaxID=2057004 RepID=A0ABU9QVG3_9BURK
MRFLLNLILTLAITLCFAWIFGHIPFSNDATTALIRVGAWFGIYGDETLEDLYFYVTLSVSFVLAVAVVRQGNRSIDRRNGRGSDVE